MSSNRPTYNRDRPRDRSRNRPYNRDRNQRRRSGHREFNLPYGTIVYVLDILERGHFDGYRGGPIIQAIETPNFNLFEMHYNKNNPAKIQEKTVVTNDVNGKIGKVKKRLKYHGLTITSKELLNSTIKLHLEDAEQLYIRFLNNAGPITKKRHQLNLLPGVGEKVMWEILEARKKPFENFKDFDARVKSINDIKGVLTKRILNEIIDDESSRYLFVKRKIKKPDSRQERPYDRRSRNPRSRPYQKRY